MPRPYSVHDAHARPHHVAHPGERLQHGRAVIHALAAHRANDAQVVGARADVGKQVAHRDSALAVLLVIPQRLHQRTRFAFGEGQRPLDRQRLAVIAIQPLLGIEGVDVRRRRRA